MKTSFINPKNIFIILIVALISFLFVFKLFQNNSFKKIYYEGHQKYLLGECNSAINIFLEIDYGSFRSFSNQYLDYAERELIYCRLFQNGLDNYKSGNFSDALNDFSSMFGGVERYKKILDNDGDFVYPKFYYLAQEYIKDIYEKSKVEDLVDENFCLQISSYLKNGVIVNPDDNIPIIYYSCGELYLTQGDYYNSYNINKKILLDYKYHSISRKAETSIINNPIACNTLDATIEALVSPKNEILPFLYFNCSEEYIKSNRQYEAIKIYELFLNDYPNHQLASQVEINWAKIIIKDIGEQTVETLPSPIEQKHSSSDLAFLIIQNQSPEKLRIVFYGPDIRIENLEECDECINYSQLTFLLHPNICSEDGIVGSYFLKPGNYKVVVQSISDVNVHPYVGNWELVEGSEYFHCFYILTKFK